MANRSKAPLKMVSTLLTPLLLCKSPSARPPPPSYQANMLHPPFVVFLSFPDPPPPTKLEQGGAYPVFSI